MFEKSGEKNKRSIFREAFSYLFKKPATREYPFEKFVPAEGFKGKQSFDLSLCIGCGLCSRDCPSGAIRMVEVDGKNRPMFLLDRCIFCYQCEASCARHAIKSTNFFEMATMDKSSLVIKPQIITKP